MGETDPTKNPSPTIGNPERGTARMDTLSNRFEEVKASVRLADFCADSLERKGKTYVCPKCGSGTRKNHTPAFSLKGDRWHCFSCNAGGDIFDLAGVVYGTEDAEEQYRHVCEYAGSEPNARAKAPGTPPQPQRQAIAANPPEDAHKAGRDAEAAYIDVCAAAMVETCEGWAYLTGRSITPEQIRQRRLGWNARSRRVVIPFSGRPGEFYHVDRDVTGRDPRKYLKPAADKVGGQPINNPEALRHPYCIVVEGMFDALAVESRGYPAVTLCGTAWRELASLMGELHYTGEVGVMLDADKDGERHGAELVAALQAVGVSASAVGQLEGCKDAAEAVEAGRADELGGLLDTWRAGRDADRAEREERAYAAALKSMRVLDPTDIAGDLFLMKDASEPIPTGIDGLDTALNGGLSRGLYILGAGSSIGKTTLTVQIADTMAAAGQPVLFVTIEQSAAELVAKSVTRLMHRRGVARYWEVGSYDLGRKSSRERWPEAVNEIMMAACEEYAAKISPRLKILEGVDNPSIADIGTIAAKIAQHDGKAPVIFIDYLQLLRAPDARMSDKERADYNVTAARQMARELKTTVFCISTLNRSSYSGVIEMDSFKESGGIEYGADVLMGLQPAGIADGIEAAKKGDRDTEAKRLTDQAKRDTERQLEIKVLKNRNGALPRRPIRVRMDSRAGLFVTDPKQF